MRISHLDGLRGVAILWVLLFHAYARWPQLLNFVPDTKDIIFFKYGFLGVQLFFMISGYVIFMTLDKSNNIIEFAKKRWLRLFPAMLIATILIFSTAQFFYERPAGIPSIQDVIPGLTFISPSIINALTGYGIKDLEGSFWSLYVEVIFYIFISFIYFIFGRKYCIPFLVIASISFFLATIINNSIGFTLLLSLTSILGFKYYIWFIVGCVLHDIINNKSNKFNNIIAIFSIIIGLSLSFYESKFDYFLVLFHFIILSVFIFSFYSTQIKHVLSIKFLGLIGFVSYPLYLIHENMLIASLIKMEKISLPTNIMYFMPLFFSAILALIAYIIAKHLEPLLRSFLSKKLIKVRKPEIST